MNLKFRKCTDFFNQIELLILKPLTDVTNLLENRISSEEYLADHTTSVSTDCAICWENKHSVKSFLLRPCNHDPGFLQDS